MKRESGISRRGLARCLCSEDSPYHEELMDDRCRIRKKHPTMKKRLSWILLAVFLMLGLTGACADPSLTLQDSSVRSGPWTEVYAQILQERAPDIRGYEEYLASITSNMQFRPVGLTDLTGDGVPELIFLDLVKDTEYGFNVGRVWIYTADKSGVHCALTLQPEIDEMLYSTFYGGKNGLLTVHFNDTERTWTMKLQPDRGGHYEAKTILMAEEDFSGEGPDLYYLNGKKVSAKKYRSEMERIQSGQGSLIGSFMVDDGFRGFAYTLEEAQRELSTRQPDSGNGSGQLADQLPELSFSKGTFSPGQKFPVYSAPSSRSWRGAGGKAAITSKSEILVAGTDEDWILILYELNSGVIRVGYIDPEIITGSYSAGDALSFAKIPMILAKSTEITDDPVHQKTAMGKLKKGESVVCLAKYQGWIYVEAKVSGKTARGFISPSALGSE